MAFLPPFPQPYTKVLLSQVLEIVLTKKANVDALTTMLNTWIPGEPELKVAPNPEIQIRFLIGRNLPGVNPLVFLNPDDSPGPSYNFNLLLFLFPVTYNDQPCFFNPYRFSNLPFLVTWEREFLGLSSAEANFNLEDPTVSQGNSFRLMLAPILPYALNANPNKQNIPVPPGTNILEMGARNFTWTESDPKKLAYVEKILALRQFQKIDKNHDQAYLSEIVSINNHITVHELRMMSVPANYVNVVNDKFVDFFNVKSILVPAGGSTDEDQFVVSAKVISQKISPDTVLKKYT